MPAATRPRHDGPGHPARAGLPRQTVLLVILVVKANHCRWPGIRLAAARVINAERSATRFADMAGYTSVKAEIIQVTGYLRDPSRDPLSLGDRTGCAGPA